jgi:hypothetical protein
MDWLRFAGVAMMSVSSACTITTPCDGDVLYVHPVPGDTTVAIGQQFTARISVSTCGKRAVDDTFTWSSEDTTVLRVERETGLVMAVASGRTRLIATGVKVGQLGAGTITVR